MLQAVLKRLESEVKNLKGELKSGEKKHRERERELAREFDRDPRNWGTDGPPADILLIAGVVARRDGGTPVFSRRVRTDWAP